MTAPLNQSVEIFPIFMCILSDVPREIDCGDEDPLTCIKCRVRGGFFDGSTLKDTGSSSQITCLLLGIFTVFIGLLGMFTNSLIIAVMDKRRPQRTFDVLLKILAITDFFCCIICICDAIVLNTYFGNWSGRGLGTLYSVMIFHMGFFWVRTATTFMTILITIERFLVITFPLRSVSWFTPKSAKLYAAGMFLFATLINLPRWTSFSIGKNPYHKDSANITSISEVDYIIRGSGLEKIWFGTLKGLHYKIDFWVPLPVLLGLNLFSFIRVHQMSRKRKEMNVNVKREIQALKVFLPVAIFLVFCNIFPLAKYYHIDITKTVYRELLVGLIFSVCLNSSMNFLFYYVQASGFRVETKAILHNWKLTSYVERSENQTEMMTRSNISSSDKTSQSQQNSVNGI